MKVLIAARVWKLAVGRKELKVDADEGECATSKVTEEFCIRRIFQVENGCSLKKPRGAGINNVITRGREHYLAAEKALSKMRLAEIQDYAVECGNAKRVALTRMLEIVESDTEETNVRISAAKAVASLAGSRDQVEQAQMDAKTGRANLGELVDKAIQLAGDAGEE